MRSCILNYECEGQISLFEYTYKPGEYVESSQLRKELSFDEITKEIGNLIVIDCSTVSRSWFKVVRVENITNVHSSRRLIYNDGKRQRGLVNEVYFDNSLSGMLRSRAWRLK